MADGDQDTDEDSKHLLEHSLTGEIKSKQCLETLAEAQRGLLSSKGSWSIDQIVSLVGEQRLGVCRLVTMSLMAVLIVMVGAVMAELDKLSEGVLKRVSLHL